METIFSKIINKKVPSFIIYEDELVLSFLDVYPEQNGHVLIIPKKHYLNIDDIDDNALMHIMNVSRKIKKELELKLKIDGLTLRINNDDAQHIKHFHLHLIPFYNDEQKLEDVELIYNKLKQ